MNQDRDELTEMALETLRAFLPCEVQRLAPHDNLIAMGLDSLHILKIANDWRRDGKVVTFAALIERPTLADWVDLLKATSGRNVEREVGGGEFVEDEFEDEEPFALTDVQHAYWVGRSDAQALGGIGCHAYLEIDGRDVDPVRLEGAWATMFAYHPMLRARFDEEGRQWIPATVEPRPLRVHDLRETSPETCAAALQTTRDRLSHRRMRVEIGEVVGLELSLLPGGAARLHFDIDLLVADVLSLQILLRDLARAYRDGTPPAADPRWRFRSYLRREGERRGREIEQAQAYWRDRLPDLPMGPQLPVGVERLVDERPTFRRRDFTLDSARWERLKRRAAAHRVTPAMTLACAFAEVLARWSTEPRFLLNVPLFDRHAQASNVEHAVADFTNLLLLTCDHTTEASFAVRVERLQRQFHADVAHSAYSGVRVQRDLARARRVQGAVAPVVFACNLGMPLLDVDARACLGEMTYMISQTPQVWLDHQVYEIDGRLLLAWDAVEGLFSEGVVDAMFEAYERLLLWLSEEGDAWESATPELLPSAQIVVRERVNGTREDMRARVLHEGLFVQALEHPERVALVQGRGEGARRVSYGELAHAALQVAHWLVDEGVRVGEPVAVQVARGVEQVVAMLGVLAAGACYVPISVNQPRVRRERILRRAGARFLVTEDDGSPSDAQTLILMDAFERPALSAPVEVSPSSLAYVIFTSGSTGEPKGVEIKHRAACNTIDNVNARYGVNAASRGLGVSSFDFDLSVYDVFGLLQVGGGLVLVSEDERRDASAWLELVHEHGVTVWNSVPVLLDMLLVAAEAEARPRSLPLRQVLVSGDWIALELPERLVRCSVPGVKFVAMGGATEASIWSNVCDVSVPLPRHWRSIPYGRPLANQCYRVVDARGRDCPDWVAGELWIGGAGVAEGYRGDATRTREVFVTHAERRWYRTGDRGRYWPDGTLEFLGRVDHQVKVRGHRIELGEVESALSMLTEVDRAVVMTVGAPAVLVAAVSLHEAVAVDVLQARLRTLLPEWMVPGAIVPIETWPLSANGKVDRVALGETLMQRSLRDPATHEPPHEGVEQVVAGIWRDVLDVTAIGRTDSFFTLGGDSLQATQVVARLKAVGLRSEASLRDLFAHPVLHRFAGTLLEGTAIPRRTVVSRPAERGMPFPMTEVQRAYWMGQSPGLPLTCGTRYLIELEGAEVDVERLERAWNRLITRHEMMRIRVVDDEHQQILGRAPWSRVTTIALGVDANEDDARARIQEAWQQRYGTRRQPSHRILVVRHGDGRCRLGVFFDYIAVDGFSVKLILQQLASIYREPELPLNPLTLSFRDYVTQVAHGEEERTRAEAYFRELLETLPLAPALPLACDPETTMASKFRRRNARLEAPTWGRLREYARGHGVTPSTLLLAAYGEVLSRWCGGQAFTINVTLFDREPVHPEMNELVGDFTSLAPVAYRSGDDTTFTGRAHALQQQIAGALEHRAVSSIWLQREWAKTLGRAAAALPVVFTSTLGLQDGLFEQSVATFPRLARGGLSETPQVWLDHHLYEYDGGVELSWDSVDALFPEGMLDDMFEAYVASLHSLAERGCAGAYAILLPERQRETRARVNATEVEGCPRTLHEGFFGWAAREPERVAVVQGCGASTQTVRYGALARRALQVACALREAGVRAGDPVAVMLPRGVSQIAAMLGVLAAGGCYVPLSVHQPWARRQRILQRAGVQWLLTDEAPEPEGPKVVRSSEVEGPEPEGPKMVRRSEVEAAYAEGSKVVRSSEVEAPEPAGSKVVRMAETEHWTPLEAPVHVSPSSLAYVIFTSGSTGEPKGVEISHGAAANTIDDVNTRYGIDGSSRVLGVSSYDFDLSVYDVFGLLHVGGSVVVVTEDERRDASAWMRSIREHGVTVWNTVPVLLEMLLVVAEGEREPLGLRQVLLSGDWIGLDLPARVAKATRGAAKFVAMGGATEGSIWSNVCEVEVPLPADWRSIPYGKPLANQAYRVVDAEGRDCPDWVVGELWIGGAGVAEGYRGDEARTRAQFVDYEGQRWYRTGDRGRYWPDGTLEFLGREDQQVKVRGHRIELGEVEAALTKLEEVAKAVALTVGRPPSLAAAVTLHDGIALDGDDVQERLRALLPEWMVPTSIAFLETWPLSANGKVDRKALAERFEGRDDASAALREPPRGPVESTVAEIWREVLGVEEIGRADGFFALGGDSLRATQVVARLQARGLDTEAPLRDLFAHPVLSAFASRLEACGAKQGSRIVPDPEGSDRVFDLTEVQRAYWMGQAPGLPLRCGTHYVVELEGDHVDLERFEAAIERLVARHEMLRAVVTPHGRQHILREVAPVRFELRDLRGQGDITGDLDAWLRTCEREDGKVLRLRAYREAHGRCRIAMMFDYLFVDGFSIRILLNELHALYRGDETLAPIGMTFRDYVEQVRPDPEALRRAEAYWQERVESLPAAPELPLACEPSSLERSGFHRRFARIEARQWSRVRESARAHGLTPSVLVLTMYAEILSRWSGGAPITLNMTLFDRRNVHPDIERVVGDFTSLAPVAYVPDTTAPLLDAAKAMQQEIALALQYREVSSIGVQRERGRKSGGVIAGALPVVFTSTLGMSDRLFDDDLAPGFPDLVGGGFSETPQVWLDHQMYEHKGELLFSWDAVDALFPPDVLDAMFAALADALETFDAGAWLKPLAIALPERQRETRAQVNATEVERRPRTLHEGFFGWAAREPERVAVVQGHGASTQTVLYGALARRALQVACALREAGVRAGDPVAVMLPRGVSQIAAMLGVLAAGGCYVPLSVHQPRARWQRILQRAGVQCLLTDEAPEPEGSKVVRSSEVEAPEPAGPKVVRMSETEHCTPLEAPVQVSPSSLAYVIFTSGSTGEPKGVEISHSAAANTIDDVNARYGIDGSSRVLGVSSYDFDLSVYDVFGLLHVGGSVVVVTEDERRDASAWMRSIREHGVTVWNTVPVLLEMLLVVAEGEREPLGLRQVLLSGDWIGLDLPERVAKATRGAAKFVAMGGATEGSIWSNVCEVEVPLPAEWRSIPYGKPLANQAYRVVDAEGRDCPDWVVGELWIGGVGVAEGYRGDEARTRAQFVEHEGRRWYRTGDRGRYWADGTLEFLGREDQQVKVRGHRIELGEVEAALTKLEEVAKAVALTVGRPPSLAAAVTLHEGVALDGEGVQERLRTLLPEWMVPTSIAFLETWPLSANGKVNRKSLGELLGSSGPRPGGEPPRDALERSIAEIWSETLGRKALSRHEDFFMAGGDSLRATQIVQRLQDRGLCDASVGVRVLFSKNTIAALADYIRSCETDAARGRTEREVTFEEGVL